MELLAKQKRDECEMMLCRFSVHTRLAGGKKYPLLRPMRQFDIASQILFGLNVSRTSGEV